MRFHPLFLAAPLAALGACARSATPEAAPSSAAPVTPAASPEIRTVQFHLTGLS